MRIEEGEVLVFVGRKDGGQMDDHFRNFKVGERYEISDITTTYYDIDEYTRMGGRCVLFKDFNYGCHEENLDIYFVRQDEWRESLLSKILPKQIIKILKKI